MSIRGQQGYVICIFKQSKMSLIEHKCVSKNSEYPGLKEHEILWIPVSLWIGRCLPVNLGFIWLLRAILMSRLVIEILKYNYKILLLNFSAIVYFCSTALQRKTAHHVSLTAVKSFVRLASKFHRQRNES